MNDDVRWEERRQLDVVSSLAPVEEEEEGIGGNRKGGRKEEEEETRKRLLKRRKFWETALRWEESGKERDKALTAARLHLDAYVLLVEWREGGVPRALGR